MRSLLQDVAYGVRTWRQKPASTVGALLSLALGIGINSAMFSVVNSVLLRPLVYPHADRLVVLWKWKLADGSLGSSPADFLNWQEQITAFEQMGASLQDENFNLASDGTIEPQQVQGQRVTAGFLRTLGVTPLVGRSFLEAEELPGSDALVLLSHRLWRNRFGANPGLLGAYVRLNGESRRVAGILPDIDTRTDVWVPLHVSTGATGIDKNSLQVIARSRPGIAIDKAQSELDVITARSRTQSAGSQDLGRPTLVPMFTDVVGNAREILLPLTGAVALVLLIACATVATLLLARVAERRREMATRSALGANRSRLVRQLLTENLVLAVAGGGLGLLTARGALSALVAAAPKNIPRLDEIEIDWRVLGFTMALSLLTGIVFGLAPALQASRNSLSEALGGGRASRRGWLGRIFRSGLLVTEITLALVLLTGAGLLLNSFMRLASVDPGFQADHAFVMQMSVPQQKYSDGRELASIFSTLLQRVESIAGIESVGVSQNLPLAWGTQRAIFHWYDANPSATSAPTGSDQADLFLVSPGYLKAMGIPLLRGRQLNESDRAGSAKAIIVSQSLALTSFPHQDPIGRGMHLDRKHWCVIVGVAGDTKATGIGDQLWLGKEAFRSIYAPYDQFPDEFNQRFWPLNLVVRTAASPFRMSAAIRNEIRVLDPDQPVQVRTLQDIVMASLGSRRIGLEQLLLFGAVALLLAAGGVYSVVAHLVAHRTREIGIRMAVGARRRDVLLLVMRESMASAVAGIGIGWLSSLVLTKVLASRMYGMTTADPATYASVALLLAAIVALASYIPARRATRVDPVAALRAE